LAVTPPAPAAPSEEKTEAARLAPLATAQNRAHSNAPAAARNVPPKAPGAHTEPADPARPASARTGPQAGPAPAGTERTATTAVARPKSKPLTAPVQTDGATQVGVAAGSFGINVGLFADDNNARNALVLLSDAGLPAYTQVLRGKKGKLTRVRVGPFDAAAQAERAAEKIRALGLDALVFQQAQ
jgi:cell division septation protein DedD